MLHAIGLAQMLAQVPVRTKGQQGAVAGAGAASPSRARVRGTAAGSEGGGGADGGDDDEDEEGEEGAEDELGEVVNAFVLELLGCWGKYEDLLLHGSCGGGGGGGRGGAGASSSGSGGAASSAEDAQAEQELRQLGPTLAALLRVLLPVALALLTHPNTAWASTVVPCLSRFVALLKQQHAHRDRIAAHLAAPAAGAAPGGGGGGAAADFLVGLDYLRPLLTGIYLQVPGKGERVKLPPRVLSRPFRSRSRRALLSCRSPSLCSCNSTRTSATTPTTTTPRRK